MTPQPDPLQTEEMHDLHGQWREGMWLEETWAI